MSIKFDARPASPDKKSLPASLAFSKMQGAGNDYIYVENFEGAFAQPGPLAVLLSNRHFGIGADGLVLMGPPSPEYADRADFRMRIFNADGSEAQMCGNASRCVGKYLYEKGFSGSETIRLQTGAGVRTLHLDASSGKVRSVRVDMGEPILKPALIPMRAPGESFIGGEIMVDGKSYRGTAVSLGNPHLVLAWDGLEGLDIERLGPKFERHELFPQRVNTEFIEVKARSHIRMRVWERGSGETLACGTGACASLVAAVLNGWTGRKARLELRGGDLEIEWTEADNHVHMSGPAEFTFSGVFGSK